MQFKMVHENYNVQDLNASIDFYSQALGLAEVRRTVAPDNSFTIVFMGNKTSDFLLELTYLRDKKGPYNLGDCEFHLAFETDDFDAAYLKHKQMDCICYENKDMGVYFITDPDGYWIEIVPSK